MFDFARPDLKVYALPLLALLVLAMAWSRALPGWSRRIVSWILRSAMLLLCLLALALPEVRRDLPEEKALILVVDVSDSLPRQERERALSEVREVLDALRHAPPAAETPAPAIERLLGGGDRPRGLDDDFLKNGGLTSTALIAFAGQAALVASSRGGVLPWTSEVERGLSDPDLLQPLDPLRSRITPALTLAASLFPGVAERRVVVWTDGRLEEPVASAAEWRAASGARSLVLFPLGLEAPRDVRVIDLQVPSDATVTEMWNAVLSVESTAPGPAKVTLKAGDKVLSTSDVKISAGRQEVTFPNLRLPEGLHKITATVEMPGDVERRNDVGLAAVRVRGKYRLLLVEGVAEAGEAVARALAAQELAVERVPPSMLAKAQLADYSAIVLAEVAPKELPRAVQNALAQYVEEQGGGLFVITGSKPEVAAGYRKSMLESILPVAFREADPPDPTNEPPKDPPKPEPPKPNPPKDPQKAKVEAPGLVLMLLIDRSGSMVGKPLKLAEEAAIASANTLADDDLLGVIAFDEKPHWVVHITPAGKRDSVAEQISSIRADGGTDIYNALAETYGVLRHVDAGVKHVIVLSDGFTPIADFQGLVTRMAKDNITVTTVAVGEEFDSNLMNKISTWGKGMFYFSHDFAEVPEIFTKETKRIVGMVPRKNPTAPTPDPPKLPPQPSPPMPELGKPKTPEGPPKAPESGPTRLKTKDEVTFLAGVDLRTLPIVEKRVRLDARVGFYPMVTEKAGEPFLATGRAGLGRTAVLATDLRGEGAPEWVRWKELPRVLAQLAKSLAAAPEEKHLSTRLTYRLEDRSAVLSVDVPEERIGGVKDLAQRLVWRMPEGRAIEVPLERIAPGRYEAHAPLDLAGRWYVAELEQRADMQGPLAGGIQQTTEAGVSRAYDLEFARVGRDAVRFRRLSAGATMNPSPEAAGQMTAPTRTTRWGYGAWFLLAAAALLPLDLAVRRWKR